VYLIQAGEGARTLDPQLGKLMLYQLSYARVPVDSSPRYRSSGSSEIAPPDDEGTGRRGSRTPMSGGGCLRSRSQTSTRFTIDRMAEVYAVAGAPSYTSMNRR
jgi:hypothetical protein